MTASPLRGERMVHISQSQRLSLWCLSAFSYDFYGDYLPVGLFFHLPPPTILVPAVILALGARTLTPPSFFFPNTLWRLEERVQVASGWD